MESLVQIGLSNAVAATALAGLALLVKLVWRRPAVVHAMWLLVLLKLVTPPLWTVPVKWGEPGQPEVAEQRAAAEGGSRVAVAEQIVELAPMEGVGVGEVGWEMVGIATVGREGEVDEAGEAAGIAQGPLASFEDVEEPGSAADARASIVPIGQIMRMAGWVWLGGSVVCLGVIALRIHRLGRLLRYLRPAPEEVQRQAAEVGQRVGVRAVPRVWLAPGGICPMLLALGGAPRLLIPAQLWDRLGEGERGTLLLHELAHLRRRDHWVRYLELVVTVAYWWNPVAWWARHELREAEEQCCDAWVVWAMPRGVRDYAVALLEAVSFASEGRPAVPVLASGMSQFYQLRRRLIMIKQKQVARSLSWSGFSVMCGLGALLLPLGPTLAQSDGEAPAAGEAGVELTVPAEAELGNGVLVDELVLNNVFLETVDAALVEEPAAIEAEKARRDALAEARAQVEELARRLEEARWRLERLEAREARPARVPGERPRAATAGRPGYGGEALLRPVPRIVDGESAVRTAPRRDPYSATREPDAAPQRIPGRISGGLVRPVPAPDVGQPGRLEAPIEHRLDQLEMQLKAMLNEIQRLRAERERHDPGEYETVPAAAPIESGIDVTPPQAPSQPRRR